MQIDIDYDKLYEIRAEPCPKVDFKTFYRAHRTLKGDKNCNPLITYWGYRIWTQKQSRYEQFPLTEAEIELINLIIYDYDLDCIKIYA